MQLHESRTIEADVFTAFHVRLFQLLTRPILAQRTDVMISCDVGVHGAYSVTCISEEHVSVSDKGQHP